MKVQVDGFNKSLGGFYDKPLISKFPEVQIGTIQPFLSLGRINLVPVPSLFDSVNETVNRTWKERLFTWPWKPFVKTKIITVHVPMQKIFINQHDLYAHPVIIEKLVKEINHE